MASKTVSFTCPGDLLEQAQTRCDLLGYGGFSEYLQFLLRIDVSHTPDHVRNEKGHQMVFLTESSDDVHSMHRLLEEILSAAAQAAKKEVRIPPTTATPRPGRPEAMPA
jgi:hypothetical protein